MMYAARMPPKMTTSEASSHQTASFDVRIPVDERVVAMGLNAAMRRSSRTRAAVPQRGRHTLVGLILWPEVVFATGHRVLVGASVQRAACHWLASCRGPEATGWSTPTCWPSTGLGGAFSPRNML